MVSIYFGALFHCYRFIQKWIVEYKAWTAKEIKDLMKGSKYRFKYLNAKKRNMKRQLNYAYTRTNTGVEVHNTCIMIIQKLDTSIHIKHQENF